MMEAKEHLKKIVAILVDSIPAKYGLRSIVLYGAFARGEGRMIEGAKGKIPYGDYDFLVITRRSLPEDLIQRILYDKIYKDVMYGTSVDITNETVSSLRGINSDLSSYDLIQTGKTIWGEELLGKITINIADIPVMSFLRIINNRINVILMEYEKQDSLTKSIIKLYLDIGGYLSFIHKVYSPIFKERIKRLERITSDDFSPELIKKIEKATKMKLIEEPDDGFTSGYIEAALNDGVEIMQEIISKIFNKKPGSLSVKEIADLIYKKLPARYYQGFIARNVKCGICRLALKPMLPFLSRIANLYENSYFRRHAITKDKFFLGHERRSPIIINMYITFLLAHYLIEKNKDYLKDAGVLLGRISPGCEADNFKNLKDINNKLWLGYTRRARKRNLYKALSDLFIK